MGELTNRVKTVRIEAERAVQIMLDAAEIIDNAAPQHPTPTIVEVSLKTWAVTSGSGGCRIKGHPAGDILLREGDVYALHYSCEVQETTENLVALRTSLSECIRQRDEARLQVDEKRAEIDKLETSLVSAETRILNLQDFNDKQRQQLESLQKEMAAIHMCVTAESRTKLDDAISMHGREMPFLLKAVWETMDRYFNTKGRLNQLQSLVDKFIKETK